MIKNLTNKSLIPFEPNKQIASDSFRKNICFLAILSIIIAGSLSFLSGILSVPIGKSLGFPNNDLAFIALINLGLLLGNIVGYCSVPFMIKVFTCRGTVIISAIIALLAAFLAVIDGLLFIPNNSLSNVDITASVIFAVVVFLSGIGFGSLYNVSLFLLIGIFRVVNEDSKWVNFAQGAFAAFVAIFSFLSAIIVQAVSSGNSWYIVYLVIVGFSFLLILTAYFVKTGESKSNLIKFIYVDKNKAVSKKTILDKQRLNHHHVITFGVVMAALALTFYIMIDNTQTFWYGSYLAQLPLLKNSNPGFYSALFVGIYYTGIALGCLFIRQIAKRMPDFNLIFVMSPILLVGLTIMATTYTMRNNSSIMGFVVQGCFGSLIIGLGASIMYATILNLGIKQSVKANPINQAFVSNFGTFGSILANTLFFAIAYGTGKSILSYSIPLFYAPFWLVCLVLCMLFAKIWRSKSKEGRYITKTKSLLNQNVISF